MRKVIAWIFIALGVALILVGSYKQINKEESSTNIDNNQGNNVTVEDEIKEIETYLNQKYNETFNGIELVKEFCIEKTDDYIGISLTCDDSKILDKIYIAKNSEGMEFYVKKVSYDESKITLTDSQKESYSVGIYDTYIAHIVTSKIEEIIADEYTNIFGKELTVDIYDGIGISNISHSNAYQDLDKKYQDINDTNISVNEYLSRFDNELISEICLLVKIDESITKDNFQDFVSKLKDNDVLSVTEYDLDVDTIKLLFNNDNKFIEYYSSAFIDLRYGDDILSFFNDNVYENTVVMDDAISVNDTTEGFISYENFMDLDKETFDF